MKYRSLTFGNYYWFDLTAVVVEQQSFPGNLLIGYDTMREEDITIIPAKEGVQISFKFQPFVNTRNQEFVATVSQHRTTEAITVSSINNVAERYLTHPSTIPNEIHIPNTHHEEIKSPPNRPNTRP